MPLGFGKSIFAQQVTAAGDSYSAAQSAYDMTSSTGSQHTWTWRASQYGNVGPHHSDDMTAGTFSFWFKHPDYDAEGYEPVMAPYNQETDEFVLSTNSFRIRIDPAYRIDVRYDTDSPGGTSGGYPMRNNTWHHVMWSYQLSTGGSTIHFYIDGNNYSSYTTSFDGIQNIASIGDTIFDTSVGGRPQFLDWDGWLSQVWINDEYVDLSSSTNRAKFYNAGSPVDLGSDGSTPTGNQPKIFLDGYNTSNNGTLGDDLTTGSITLDDGPGA